MLKDKKMWWKKKTKRELDSFLGENAFVKGDIEIKGGLHLEGRLEGNIKADWLTVGQKAEVKGELEVNKVTIWGKVIGKIIAKEIIEIQETGIFEGELHTDRLAITEGGIFEGRVFHLKEKSVVPFTKKNEEKERSN